MTDNHIRRQALSLDPTIAETRLRGPVRLSEFNQRESRIYPGRPGAVKTEVMISRDEKGDPIYLEHWSMGEFK